MDLEQFLHAGGADLQGLVAQLDSAVTLGAEDVVMAVGSLVEGLGTSKSDLDLLLITPRPEHLLPAAQEVALVVGRCLADVRILPRSQLEVLLAQLDKWQRGPWDVKNAAKFAQADRVLLHRLLAGRFVPHRERSEPGAVPRPEAEALCRLKLHVARHLSRTVQVDMAGLRDSGDARSLVYTAQDLLGHAVDALTAAHGLTNPNPKWRSRLLDALPDDWEASLGIRPSGETAAERVWRLHRAPEQPEQPAALEHALRITAFARAVFVWAERRLVRGQPASGSPLSWPVLERHPSDTPLPYLDLEVDFLLEEGGGQVARLNSFGTPLRLSADEFALALQLDGTLTAREAEAAVCGARAAGPAPGLAEALVLRLASANLTAK